MKAISFDVWGTLLESNPDFKKAQAALAKEFTGIQPHVWLDLKQRIKKLTDDQVEAKGFHPDRLDLYKEALPGCSLKDTYDFIQYSNDLFLKYSPKETRYSQFILNRLREKDFKIYVSSNTVFIYGLILSKVLYDKFGIISKNCNFSDVKGVSKPSQGMFEFPVKPLYHIGDNVITDGACEKYGIKFYDVNKNSLYNFLEYAEI